MVQKNPTLQSFDHIKSYVNIKIDIILLSISSKLSKAASYLVFLVIMGFIALFASLFLSMSLSSWLENVLNIPGIGNLIVSLIYIILGLILFVFRNQLIIKPVSNTTSKLMDFSDLHESELTKGDHPVDESIELLKQELNDLESSIESNMADIKEYYSFNKLKDRFLESIISNPKSLLNTLLIIREFIKNRRKKK
jgi:hypothetical protein